MLGVDDFEVGVGGLHDAYPGCLGCKVTNFDCDLVVLVDLDLLEHNLGGDDLERLVFTQQCLFVRGVGLGPIGHASQF